MTERLSFFAHLHCGQPESARIESSMRAHQNNADTDRRGTNMMSRLVASENARRAVRTQKANYDTELAARRFRESDPFERAKVFLQRKGFPVYAAKITRPGHDGIVVGTRLLARAEVVEMARAKGFAA